MSQIFRQLGVLTLISIAVAASAFAQTAIDQENPASAWSCINTGFFTQTQTFSPTFDRMNFADIYLSAGAGSPDDGEFSVRVSRNGSLVAESQPKTIPATLDSGSQFHRFEFDRDVRFVRNAQYELELVNHSGTTYFSWCQSQTDSYAGGAPNNDPPIGSETADFLFRTGMQSIYTDLAPAPAEGDYVYFESAREPTAPPGGGITISNQFYSGLNFAVDRPTRISRLGASFSSGSQTIFAALFKATGFIDPPDSVDLTSPDVVATTLIDIPSRPFGGPPVEAFGEVDVVVEPGQYGVVFGSGQLGATGQSGLPAVEGAYRSQFPYTFRTSDSERFTSAIDVRVLVEADSLPGTYQARAVYDAEAQLYGDTWVIIDGEPDARPDLFPFYDIDNRGLMEFSLAGIPSGAVVDDVRIELKPDQISGNAQGDSAVWVVHGFDGEGMIGSGAAASPLNEIGRSEPLDDFDPVTIQLDGDYVQSLLDAGASHLGIMMRGGENGLSANYLNWESGRPEAIPLLTIHYSSPGDYNGDGTVNLADYTVWRDSLSGPRGPELAADGDRNGVVDIDDYLLWKENFGAASTAASLARAAVPESTGFYTLVALPLCWAGVRIVRPWKGSSRHGWQVSLLARGLVGLGWRFARRGVYRPVRLW